MSRNFYPGVQTESIREEALLKELPEQGWRELVTVGTLSVPDLVFSRGSATLSSQSQETLKDLAAKLEAWPQYYLLIHGNASKVGDVEANKQLAARRAQGALECLQNFGIPKERMRTIPGELTGETRVTFEVGQIPY
jgi:outer membrane protein OmpA-like peptidoglycan-associated protein